MRRSPRLTVNWPVTLTGWGDTAQAELANLSLNGAFIIGATGTALGAPLVNLRFAAPQAGLALDVLGRVKHVTPPGLGVELLDLGGSARAEVWRVLAPRFPVPLSTCLLCQAALPSGRPVCPRCRRSMDFSAEGYEEVLRDSEPLAPAGLVGFSPVMQEVFQAARRLAGANLPLLLTGPPGSGKETLARFIHALSRRGDRPFVVISCGALREWQDSELFQSASDPYSRQSRYAPDPLKLAWGGTLYLEEVGLLPTERQGGLVRFLEQRTPASLAGPLPIPLEVRFISGSCTPLRELVRAGRFREDLARYLSAAQLTLPPLKDRGDDVLILAAVWVKQFTARLGREILGLAREAAAVLRSWDWPGNLDELMNRLQRAVVLAEGPWLTPLDLHLPPRLAKPQASSGWGLSRAEACSSFEKELLAETLGRCQGNLHLAAQALELSTAALKRLVRRHNLTAALRVQGENNQERGPPEVKAITCPQPPFSF